MYNFFLKSNSDTAMDTIPSQNNTIVFVYLSQNRPNGRRENMPIWNPQNKKKAMNMKWIAYILCRVTPINQLNKNLKNSN